MSPFSRSLSSATGDGRDDTPRPPGRRSFLKTLALTGGALLLGGHRLMDRPERLIGVQLYTLRERMQQDFAGTLEQVAAIGYREVEFAGYFDRRPEQVRALLERLNLTAPSTHIGLDALRNDLDGQLETARTIGHRYVTVPAIMEAFTGTMTPDAWSRYAAEFNRIGAACRDKGLTLAYHNHHFEFVPAREGRTGFDVLLAETDPDLVVFELDLMWATLAGHDPVTLFERYPGRFVMWHVKDLKSIETARAAAGRGMEGFRTILGLMADVGAGEIDFARIFARAEQAGVRHLFVEHDAPQDALASITNSFRHVQALLAP